jgi:hypothetical protein
LSEIDSENVCDVDVNVERRLFGELSFEQQLHHVTRTLDDDRKRRKDIRPITQKMVKKYLLRYAPLTEISDAICLIQKSKFPIKTSLYAFLVGNKDERIFSLREGKCVFSPNFEEEEEINLYQKTPFEGFLPNPITEDEFKTLAARITKKH